LASGVGMVAWGCGGTTTGPTGDSTGEHLIAFASDRNQAAGQYDIYLYDLDQLGFRVLTGLNSSTPDLQPALSPDGRFIAFQSARGATGSDILLYDRSVGALIGLPGVNTNADETEPAFTGDQLKLAFVQSISGFTRIRMVDGIPDTLLGLPGLDTMATFSDSSPAPNHDGSTIAFVSDRDGNSDVLVWRRGVGILDLAGLRSPQSDLDPALSGDGRYLCFASDRAGGEGGLDLYLFDLQDSTLTRLDLPSTDADEHSPTVSVDGDVISFASNRPDGLGQTDVWNYNRTMAAVGQGTQQGSTGNDLAPSLRWR
jgi:Tol biopolymer transport system component